MSKVAGPVDPSLHPLLQAALPRFSRSVGFLQAYCDYVLATKASPGADRQSSSSSDDDSTSGEDPVTKALVDNLSSPSHDLRLATLRILQQLQSTPDEQSILSLMTDIEETPLSIETMRTIGMHLRKIGLSYASLTEGSWLRQAVPSFLFGMMTLKLTPLWNDATEALKQVSETKSGEEIITTLALEWLTVPSMRGSGPPGPPPARNNSGLTNFDCTNIQRLQGQADEIQQVVDKALDMMLESFDKQQESVEIRPANARSQALKVLNALPAVAEKRSRKLVPFFLSWAEETPETDEGQEDSDSSQEGQTWSLFDRKALLSVFNQFVNPRSLYESQRVYSALLHLMENGDIEVQKSTLKALLGWKQEGVKPYQENLEYLLDEARFKNELTVLMQGEQTIQPEHRAELMPILLRLLYGRTISKKGAASGRHGLQATRLAVLRNLSQEDMGSFLDIAVGKLRDVRVVDENGLQESVVSRELLPPRKQVGFMNMMMPLVNELGADVEPYVDTLLNAVLYCLIYSCRKLREIADEAEADSDEEGKEATHESLMKVVRTAGLKCIIALFRNAPDFAWDRFANTIITEVVSPRIPNLPQENTQGVSGLLQLLHIWSQLPKAAMYLAMNKDIVPKIIEVVSMERSKDDVKVFCLTIIRNLIKLASASAIDSEFNELIKVELLDPSTDLLLRNVAVALKSEGISGTFLEACLETVVEISPFVETSENVQEILQISTFLLNQPAKKVSPRAKGQILLILEQFVTLHEANGVDLSPSTKLFNGIFETVSSLFSYFKDRDNRQTACRLLAILAQKDASLEQVAKICASLNSFVEDRLDEPDYDKRLTGFNEISGKQAPLDNRQWLPLLHNLTFFLGNDEEYGVLSSNAADALRTFIKDAAAAATEVLQRAFHIQLEKIVVPALYTGARDVSATVRRECLRVFGFLLSHMPTWSGVSDLKALLIDTDEESSEPAFFFNILSPATSRQLEALQMLETANETSQFSSQNLYHFFIPILEHFVVGKADNSDDKGLGAQAAITIGALSASLEWKHFRVILQRYISFVDSKPDLQKQVNRLLGKVADTLVSVTESAYAQNAMEAEKADGSSASKHLHESLPLKEKLSTDMVNNYLPSLLKHLNHKDDSEVSHRVPVGVIIVKLLTILPEDVMSLKLAGVLTDICHILRSKNSESRDMARETLSSIATILGPTHFGFILKELSSALRRGYQLHVFSYTLHSILLQVIPEFEQGSLDYCLPAIVTVIIDDVFGVTGQEKDADGYTTQMKEVKSSKSQDSMELIAKTVSVSHLVDLIRPLQALLMQKVDLKLVRKIDVLLNRITTGLLQNPAAESRDTLIFCYEVIQDVYKAQKPEAEVRIDPRLKKYLYQKGVRKSERDAQTKHTYKLVKFALDILRSILKKHDSLRNEANLLGFIGIFGDAVVAGEEEVKIAAFKLLATLVKVPFDSDAGLGLYKVATKEAIKSLSYSSTTSSDLSQSALKLVSVVLRDKREIKVNPSAVEMLLGKLKDDLTEPLYRHVTFNFLRSLLDSKIETDVVYDTLDYVGTVMITNDDKDTRDLARGAFFQFLREYPQQKARWTKQLDFIVANLKYEREGGRLSVMEIIHLLLKKSLDDYVQEIVSTCFIPLVFVVANDDSEKCRLSAGELLKEIFRRADKQRQREFLDLLRSWLGQEDNDAVLSLGVQAFGFYFESREPSVKDNKEVKLVHGKIAEIIGAGDIKVADEGLVNNALAVAQTLVQQYPALLLSESSRDFWEDVRGCLAHPEASVKLSTVKLLSAYLADFAGQAAEA
ncbi:armadillo-type protein, partial [Plectosphaerella plurivora]